MARVDFGEGSLTPDEELVVQAIAGGTYFNEDKAITGTQNGVNTVFTIPGAPNPTASLAVRKNGQWLNPDDYSVVSTTLTLAVPPDPEDVIKVNYRISPV
jgi:hypothetical protein